LEVNSVWENLPELKAELDVFERLLRDQFNSKKNVNSYLDRLCLGIVSSGGKRLRPAMVIASSMMGSYEREKTLRAALSMELLHTATLVHDDIIDGASVRRSIATVSSSDGVDIAVFTGDYLYIKSILALSDTGLPVEYMKQLAQATEAVCAGEVEQFRGRGTMPGIKTYLSRIIRKTGFLFAACCAAGAKLGGLTDDSIKHAARFGSSFGAAFQIRDDILDFTSSTKELGKPAGSDLKDGVFTLPLLMASAKNDNIKKLMGLDRPVFRQIIGMVMDAGGIAEAKTVLKKYIERAKMFLNKTEDNGGRKMLFYILETTFKGFM
jgi:heptaprenyl diphosphate synthase